MWDILDQHYGHVDADLVWTVADANGIENPPAAHVDHRRTCQTSRCFSRTLVSVSRVELLPAPSSLAGLAP